MRLKLVAALSLLLLPGISYAQSVRYQGQLIGSRGLPLANQSIAVCTQPAVTTTQPCSPLATLATSTSTSSGGTNPFTSDALGNFFFYAAPGRYTVQVYGPQVGTPFVQPDVDLNCAGGGTCTVSGNITFTGNVTATAGANNYTGGVNGRFQVPNQYATLALALAACPAGTTGCYIEITSPLTFTSPITWSQFDAPLTIACPFGSDVNGNPGGTLLTYSPVGAGTTAITFSNSTNDWIIGCNITQGNTQANTNGLLFQGTQRGGTDKVQVYGFSNIDFQLADSSTSSAEYNTFKDSHFEGFGAFNTSATACKLLQSNSGKSVNQNHFPNSTCRFATVNNLIATGNVSENDFGPFDLSGNAATLVSLGDGVNPARSDRFQPLTLENAGPTGCTASEVSTTATITCPSQHGFANAQAVTVSGCSVGGYNGVQTITGLSGTPPNAFTYTTGSGLGAATGCTAQPTNQVGFALNGTALTQIYTEGGLTGPGATQVTVANGATYFLGVGSSAGAGGSRWEASTPFLSIDKQGSIGFGLSTCALGTPAGQCFSNGAPIVAGGSTVAQVNGASYGVTFNKAISLGSGANLFVSATAPTIAGAGCGGSAASIPTNNGTGAFKINVGTTPGSACTITMPAATTGWNCFATDITTNSTSVFLQKQTGAESTTSVTITNFSDVAVATAFTASDILKVSCHAD